MNAKAAFSYESRAKFPTSQARELAAARRGQRLIVMCLRASCIGITTLAMVGCQVFQPYVMPQHYPSLDEPTNTGCAADLKKGTDTDEVAYARGIQRQLSCFARQHAEFASAEGYVFIPLAALIAYQGFKQANPHNIAALSAAGFTAYGIANYQYKPRDVIYLSGVEAVNCAIQISSPSILSNDERAGLKNDYATFKGDQAAILSSISAATDNLANASAQLISARQQRALVPKSSKAIGAALDSALDALSKRLSDDQTALSATRDSLTALPKRYSTVIATDAQVRKDLASTAESIVHAVNKQIATMTPDPASLASMLTSFKLPTAATPAATGSSTTSTEDTAKKMNLAAATLPPAAAVGFGGAPDPAASALGSMQDAQTYLAHAENNILDANTQLSPLIGTLDSLTTPTHLEKLYKDCSIEVTAKVALTVGVPKDGITVTSGGQAIEVPITGGSGKYNPVVTNPQAKGTLSVAVKQGSGNSSVLSISAKDFDNDADMTVLVQDDAGAVVSLSVKVKGTKSK